MKYYLYMDEAGNHGLKTVHQSFPLFLLCGILVSESKYKLLEENMNAVKNEFWGNDKVIFHSRDIRKCEKECAILFDPEIKRQFYASMNNMVACNDYTVIASAINKYEYINRYGTHSDDVYELSLSFIIERTIFFLDGIMSEEKELEIIIEKRGAKEDKKLEEHFQQLLVCGTGNITALRLQNWHMTITFKGKKENINGLQLADLVAYPLARYVMEPDKINPAYSILSGKIYEKNGKRYGLKIYP